MDEGNYFADDSSPLFLEPYTITVTSDTTLGPGDALRKRMIECRTEKVRMHLDTIKPSILSFVKCNHAYGCHLKFIYGFMWVGGVRPYHAFHRTMWLCAMCSSKHGTKWRRHPWRKQTLYSSWVRFRKCISKAKELLCLCSAGKIFYQQSKADQVLVQCQLVSI